jgi:hypothetical protein
MAIYELGIISADTNGLTRLVQGQILTRWLGVA